MKKIDTYIVEKLKLNKDTGLSNIDEIKDFIKEIFSNTDPYMHYEDMIDKKINEFFTEYKNSDKFIIYLNPRSDKWWIEKHKDLFKNYCSKEELSDYQFICKWDEYFTDGNKIISKKIKYGGKTANEAPVFTINTVKSAISLYEGYKNEDHKEIIIVKEK